MMGLEPTTFCMANGSWAEYLSFRGDSRGLGHKRGTCAQTCFAVEAGRNLVDEIYATPEAQAMIVSLQRASL